MEVTITKCHCKKCGYVWIPRVEHKPKECPKCHRYNYDTPKQEKKVKPEVPEEEKKTEEEVNHTQAEGQ